MGLEAFYPENEAESAYGIDYRGLYGKGYRGIIFDIDNTLVPHGAPADGRARGFFDSLRELGFRTVLLSNNKEPRVKPLPKQWRRNTSARQGSPGGPDMKKP